MKILIAVTSHLSYKLIEGQIAFLTSKGFEVYFVSSFNEKVKVSVESEGGFFCPLDMAREIHPLKDFKAAVGVLKLLKKIKPDVVNVSTPKASLLFSLASFLNGKIGLIFTLRGLRSDTLTGIKHKIVKSTEWICCQLADKVIVIAPSLKKHAVNHGILKEHKGYVIGKGSSNGINLKKFTLNRQHLDFAKVFRREKGISRDAIVFGYVGRIVKDKGIRELYEAFTKINKEYPDTYLLLVGTVEEENKLDSGIIDSIYNNSHVIRLQHTDQIESIFPIMDCFILYSYREGFGNVSIEAAAMGVPIIVSNIPGLSDTIVDNETGFLSEPRNTEDLYLKMLKMLKDKDLRRVLGENGRLRVMRDFDREIIWQGQLEIYDSIYNS